MDKILDVKNLCVTFNTYAGEIKAVRGVDFSLERGETLAFVGESGCGKTVTAKALLRLLNKPFAEIKEGSEIFFNGENVLAMDNKRLYSYRGNDVSMIFQDPMTSLNPTMTCGRQIMESLMLHREMDKKKARSEAVRMLETVNIADAEKCVDYYPHQLSGGMRQRVMIAIAISCSPGILIADEPTTALDVTIQAQIMDLLADLQSRMQTSIILVSHDLGLVANFADRIMIMYAGQIMEKGTVEEIFYGAKHPYTWALLNSVPRYSAIAKEELYSLKGTPPDLMLSLDRCPFAARCEYCMQICREQMPGETPVTGTHKVSCWLRHPKAPEVKSFFEKGMG